MLYDKRWDQKVETKPVTALLIAARQKIENPENWCQKHFEDGHTFCAYGALYVVRHVSRNPSMDFTSAVKLLEKQMGSCITTFNDRHTHAEVLSAFDRAIAASR